MNPLVFISLIKPLKNNYIKSGVYAYKSDDKQSGIPAICQPLLK